MLVGKVPWPSPVLAPGRSNVGQHREYIEVHNEDPKPFVWTKTADQILASIARYAERTNASYAS